MEYSAKMTNQSFWFQESKKTAECILKGLTNEDISKVAIDENIYQVENSKRAGNISRVICNRLDGFSDEILDYFLKIDVSSAKIFVLVSIMKYDDLFFEFMNVVFKDHIILGDYIIEKREVLSFLESKQLESEDVADWTENTINRLTRTYRTMLFEADIYDKETNQISIPYIDPDLVQLLEKEGFGSYIETIEI